MTELFTYSGDPSTSDKDAVRFYSGDTTDYGELSLFDAEIDYLLSANSDNVLATAIAVCERLANKCASEVNVTNLGLSVSASQRSSQFAAAAERLRAELRKTSRLNGGDLFVGGRLQDDVDDLNEDIDLVQPNFKRGMHDIEEPYDPTSEDSDT